MLLLTGVDGHLFLVANASRYRITHAKQVRNAHARSVRRWLGLARTARFAGRPDGIPRRPLEVDPGEERQSRPRFRLFDQRLSRLRAWLRLLLCAPDARISGNERSHRLRDEDHGEA